MGLTNQEIRILKNIFAKERDGVEAVLRKKNSGAPEAIAKAVVAQNFIRGALEVAVEESIPFDEVFLAELAIRLTSYVVSVAPIESHESLMRLITNSLPDAHRRRVREGIVIKTDWQEPSGSSRPNVPDRNQVQ